MFVVLALGMFGLFELQMPAAIQTRLANLANRQKGGTFVGTAVIGALTALIVTTCVAPPLIGALTFISQTGDVGARLGRAVRAEHRAWARRCCSSARRPASCCRKSARG